MNTLAQRILIAALTLACSCATFGCSAPSPSSNPSEPTQQSATVKGAYVSGTSFAPATETAINDFIDAYGKNASSWNASAYVVSDFDNTTSIFDITYQCNAHQLQTMAFALDPAGLRTALASGIDESANDNTLWLDDIESAYRHLWEAYGPFTPTGLDAQGQAAIQADPQRMEFAAKMKALYEHVEDTVDDPTACAWVLHWYAGMTEDQVYDLFKRSCETYRNVDTELVTWTSPTDIESKIGVVSCEFPLGVSVTNDVKEMLQAYSDNGIDVWICSASHVDGVRAAVDAYYLLQGRNENGKRTLRPSNDTVKLGQTEPRLFANADNETLLAYLKDHSLTTTEAFNTFAVHREADDPANVLGIAYGYLTEYDGYHSHNSTVDKKEALPKAA